MIRTTVTPDEPVISFDIPKYYVGKEIEVIAFAKEEGLKNEESLKKNTPFIVLHVNNPNYKFDRDEANER